MACTSAICWEEASLIPRVSSYDLAKSSLREMFAKTNPRCEQE